MKRRFLGGFAATVGLAVFLACSDLTGPIGEPPGGDTQTRHARISPLNRADRLPTGKGLSVSFLYIVFP
jgi:hypothetical protein